MTSITVIASRKARCGYIISDSAVTKPEGQLDRLAGKVVYSVKGCPFALGVTGNVQPEIVLNEVGQASPRTLKQLFKRLPGAVRAAMQFTANAQAINEDRLYCEVKGVAWDFARKAPVAFTCRSASSMMMLEGGNVSTLDAYAVYEFPALLGTHEPADVLLGRPVDLCDPSSFDPEVDGLALITAHRLRPAISCTPGIGNEHCRIGGEIHLTEVRKTGVQVFAIGAFPDRVGQFIDRNLPATALEWSDEQARAS